MKTSRFIVHIIYSSLALATVLWLSTLEAFAETLPIQVTSDAKTYSVTLTSADVARKSVAFWFQSNGNISEAIDLYVEGPAKGTVQLKSHFMSSGATVASLLANPSGASILPLVTGTGSERKSFTFTGTAGASVAAAAAEPKTAAAGVYACNVMSEESLEALIKFHRDVLNQDVTAKDICLPGTAPGDQASTPGSGTGSTTAGTGTFRSILSKDTCKSARSSKYLVSVNFDLTAVDPALYTNNIRLVVAIRARKFEGSKASTIKPVSEGQYAPRPLVMMSTVGGFYGGSGEKILVKKWARNKVRSNKGLKVVKYVYYRGLMLSTALVQPVLTGGKGTFELTSGTNVYSVCFNLTRTRQRANGYKN